MSFNIIKKLPSPEEIISRFPLSPLAEQQVKKDIHEVKNILSGEDDRRLLIVGPCSAWPKPAVLEYGEKLLELNHQVKDSLKIIMRVYIQKPRTTKGWTGPVNQPDPFNPPDIAAGVDYSRDLMVKIIEMGLPIADEALFTHNAKGFIELLSWVAIGARSAEDQEHRIFASAIDCAVGLKNPTHGSLAVGINSIIAAQFPHVAVFNGYEVQTSGNPFAHLVLRGSNHQSNYSLSHLKEAYQYMQDHNLQNPAVLIDASHDNCIVNGKKDYSFQPQVIYSVMETIKNEPKLKKFVKGFMVESFLEEGTQKIDLKAPNSVNLNGLSITDPCLGWPQTEKMILKLATLL